MGSAPTIDFQRLLQPIPGDIPAGIDLRAKDADSHESVYWQLRSTRNESGEIERKYILDPANAEYDLGRCRWSEIVTKAMDVLAQQSKDLEVAAWLCDSLLRTSGFAGLRDGLRLSRELVEKYWDTLYPSLGPAGDGIAARLAQFGSLFRARQHPAFRIPLTDGEKYTELDFEQAQILDKLADPKEKQARIAKGEITLQKFTDAIRETPTPFLKALAEDLEECVVEGEKLVAVLKPKCGKNERGEDLAPSARELTEVLKKVLSVVRLVAGDRIATKADAAEKGAAEAAGKSPSGGPAAEAAGPKELTRDTALARLRELADFFRRAEPHSPISHHLEEAVRWGQLPLPDLLAELIPDEKARKELFTRIGIIVPVKK
jgi:type VI secretion system protein ImpA